MPNAVDFNIVRLGCRNHLIALTDLPFLVCENRAEDWEKLEAQAVKDEDDRMMFIKEELDRGSQRWLSMGYTQANSMVLYEVFFPQGKGTQTPDALAYRIADRFKPPLTITHEGYEIIVERSEQADPYVENEGRRVKGIGEWYVVPVEISIRLHV